MATRKSQCFDPPDGRFTHAGFETRSRLSLRRFRWMAVKFHPDIPKEFLIQWGIFTTELPKHFETNVMMRERFQHYTMGFGECFLLKKYWIQTPRVTLWVTL